MHLLAKIVLYLVITNRKECARVLFFLLCIIRAVDRAPFSKTSHTAWKFEDGADMLSRNVGKWLPMYAVKNPIRGKISNFEATKIKNEYWNHDGQDSLLRGSQGNLRDWNEDWLFKVSLYRWQKETLRGPCQVTAWRTYFTRHNTLWRVRQEGLARKDRPQSNATSMLQ